jgi:ketosteroid isomerase-like protein
MAAHEPGDLVKLFEKYFAEDNLDGLMTLYEDGAVFPTRQGIAAGPREIRAVLKGYLDSGATLRIGKSIVFQVEDVALAQNEWTMETPGSAPVEGVSVEVSRRQADGTWKYIIDHSDGAALLDD